MVTKYSRALILALLLGSAVSISCITNDVIQPAPDPSTPKLHPDVRYWSPAHGTSGTILTLDSSELVEQPLPRRDDPKLVVVMYHNLVFGRTGGEYNRDIYNFEHDLGFLRRRFRIIDFHDLILIKEGRMPLDTDAAIITFDDGDLSMYAIAYPLLSEFGIKATFFLPPALIGEVGYMSWDQIREMADYRDPAAGKLFDFGSHSLTHRPLGDLPYEQVHKELAESKLIIEARTGYPVDLLALPFGSGAGDPEIRKIASNLGYRVVRTSERTGMTIPSLDLRSLGAFNVDNSSTDNFTRKIVSMTGR